MGRQLPSTLLRTSVISFLHRARRSTALRAMARLRPSRRHDGERTRTSPAVHQPSATLRGAVLFRLFYAASAVGLVSNASAHRSMISVEGVKGQHVHGEVDPDEYLWSKLPGRCCFELKEDCAPGQKKSQCKRLPPDTCRECTVLIS